MLSRIAESLYWIGRYNERAESTARILDVYSHSLLEDRLGKEESACVRLLEALGAGRHSAAIGADPEALVSFVVDDARYRVDPPLPRRMGLAQRPRGDLVGDVESINTTRDARSRELDLRSPGALGWVRDRAAIISPSPARR
jgi:hypothetical protein